MDAHYALYIWARAKRLVVYVIPSNECPYSMKGFQNMGSFIFLARTRFQAGDNTEKIWAHQFFAKQKTEVPKTHKMAVGGLGSTLSTLMGVRGQS